MFSCIGVISGKRRGGRKAGPGGMDGGTFGTTGAHCSYLNIYISQKIRLRVVDLEDQFQTTLQAKDNDFLI